MARTVGEIFDQAGVNLMSVHPNARFVAKVGQARWVFIAQDELGAWLTREFNAGFPETIMMTTPQLVALRLAGVNTERHYFVDSIP